MPPRYPKINENSRFLFHQWSICLISNYLLGIHLTNQEIKNSLKIENFNLTQKAQAESVKNEVLVGTEYLNIQNTSFGSAHHNSFYLIFDF